MKMVNILNNKKLHSSNNEDVYYLNSLCQVWPVVWIEWLFNSS